MSHRSGEFHIGCSLGCCKRCKCVPHVVSAAISDPCKTKCSLPGFLDVDSTESGFASEYERLEWMAKLVEPLEFVDHGISKGDAAWTAIFGLLEEGEVIIEINISPFEIEDFPLASAGCEGDQDDGIKVMGAALATGRKEPIDLVWGKNSVAARTFLELS